jgi:ABC-type nitrate/sulfonate/bicarbonate transport system substrate-binding protein
MMIERLLFSVNRALSGHGRKGLVAVAALAMLGSAVVPSYGSVAIASPAKLTTISIQISWLNNVEFAGIYVAQDRGYYKKYGLKVNVMPGGGTTDPRSVVANGAATIGTVAVGTDEAIADAQGANLSVFGAIYQQNPGCFMVRANSGIKNAKGFIGKSIGLQTQARDQVKGMLNYEHVPLNKVKLVIVGFDPTPFALGKVDAYTAFAFNEPIAMALQGIKTHCLSFSSMGLPSYGDVFIARKTTVNSDPQMLAKFLKATQMGWKYTLAHQAAVTQLVLKKYSSGQDPKQQKLQMGVEAKLLVSKDTRQHGLLSMTTATWKRSLSFLFKQHLVSKSLKPSDVETQKILNLASKLH